MPGTCRATKTLWSARSATASTTTPPSTARWRWPCSEQPAAALRTAERGRPLAAEQSNTSLVYDDRLILKFFRRLSPGPNPDVEVIEALARTGFSHIALPLVRWQRDGRDLAFGQQYLAGGTDGWALALTSLRDFYGAASEVDATTTPAMSGGDFAAEAARLGQMTADMHLAMAEAFGTSSGGFAEHWSALIASIHEACPAVGARAVRLRPNLCWPAWMQVRDPGPAFRAHGDYHLGQVMRTDNGWYVLDFEGEPNRPLEERQRPTSVLKDVAGMLRSLQYASRFALRERAESDPALLEQLARAWEDRNGAAFLRGYYETQGDRGPAAARGARTGKRSASPSSSTRRSTSWAMKQAYRPDWVPIPLAALWRLLSDPVEDLLAGPLEPGDEDDGDEAPSEEWGL